MRDVDIPPECVQDPFERLVPGYDLNRDPERTPMRWDTSENAGFTTGNPWLPVGPDVEHRNVAVESSDDGALLGLYRRLLALRRSEPALIVGEYLPQANQGTILAFYRCLDCKRLLIALNMGSEAGELEFGGRGTVLLSTRPGREGHSFDGAVLLQADEAIIVSVG